MLLVAFLIGILGMASAFIFDLTSLSLLFAGLSLGMIGGFLWQRKWPR